MTLSEIEEQARLDRRARQRRAIYKEAKLANAREEAEACSRPPRRATREKSL